MKKKSEKEELSGINQGTSDTEEPDMVKQAQEENVNKQKSPLWNAGGTFRCILYPCMCGTLICKYQDK